MELELDLNEIKRLDGYQRLTRFRRRNLKIGVIDNYEICPIVFNLYERLKNEFILYSFIR